MFDILGAAKAHFEKTRSIEIPEWADAEGHPAKIFWTAITADEFAKVNSASRVANSSSYEQDCRLVIAKARDENGKPVFTVENLAFLLSGVDYTIIQRIALSMCNIERAEIALKN